MFLIITLNTVTSRGPAHVTAHLAETKLCARAYVPCLRSYVPRVRFGSMYEWAGAYGCLAGPRLSTCDPRPVAGCGGYASGGVPVTGTLPELGQSRS